MFVAKDFFRAMNSSCKTMKNLCFIYRVHKYIFVVIKNPGLYLDLEDARDPDPDKHFN